jgi:hypothetical protein
MAFQAPKTDWDTNQQGVLHTDFNRIEGNSLALWGTDAYFDAVFTGFSGSNLTVRFWYNQLLLKDNRDEIELQWNQTVGTSNAPGFATAAGAVPAALRPLATLYLPVQIKHDWGLGSGEGVAPGALRIDTDGTITVCVMYSYSGGFGETYYAANGFSTAGDKGLMLGYGKYIRFTA